MPNEENGTEVMEVEESTEERTLDTIQEEMMEATSRNDFSRFDELEQEMLTASEGGSNDVEDAPSEDPQPQDVETVSDVVETPAVTPEVVKPEAKPSDNTFSDMKKAVEDAQRLAQEAQARAIPSKPAAPVVAPRKSIAAPTAPLYPEIPSDPSLWEEGDIAKYGDFQKAQQQFNNDTVQYMSQIGETTKGLVEAQQQQRVIEEQAETKRANDNAWNSHWDNVRELQKSIPSLGTDVDIVDVHKSIDSFGDDLALLNGFTRGTTPAEIETFNRAKQALIVKYKSGDQSVIEKASSAGVDKPAGFEKYMSISEVNNFRSQLISSGKLGDKASFRDAYLLKMERDGTLAESFNDVAVQEREHANVDIANKLREQQGAVRTPSSVAPASAQSTTTGPDADGTETLTADEVSFLNEVSKNPSYPFTSPQRMKAWGQLESKMSKIGYL